MRHQVLLALTMLAGLGLSSCAPLYTLSPQVKESARHYSDVMDDFADQAVLANVLRARDYAPLNFNDLSSITGALSVSGTLGFTLPFGPFIGNKYPPSGDTAVGAPRNTFSPSFTGSTSPVINIGTLNTQGFMLTMIQPISSTYILSKWNEGMDHRLLLYLFVKSIRFCDDHNAYDDKDPKTSCEDRKVMQPKASGTPCDAFAAQGLRRVHTNDPDDAAAMEDFIGLVNCIYDPDSAGGGDVDLKSLMLLDPLGNPVPAAQTFSLSKAPATNAGGTTRAVASDYNLFQTINGLSDGQLHAGNASCPFGAHSDFCVAPDTNTSYVQFYKEYPAQVVLCVNTSKGKLAGHVVSPISEADALAQAAASPKVTELLRDAADARHAGREAESEEKQRLAETQIGALQEQILRNSTGLMVLRAVGAQFAGKPPGGTTSGSTTSAPAAGGGAGGGGGSGGGGGGGGAAGAGGMSQVTMALIPSRISAIIPARYCDKDQLVLTASTEEQFDLTTTGFAHVEWRSIAEVIEYLGAISRNADRAPNWQTGSLTHYVFEIQNNGNGRIKVDYPTGTFSVGSSYDPKRLATDPSRGDHSLQTLALLNELISIAKISGTLPVSQPVQVLP